jgi:hypothetical protein
VISRSGRRCKSRAGPTLPVNTGVALVGNETSPLLILPCLEYSRSNPKMLRSATSTETAIVSMEAGEKTRSPPFSRKEERKSAEIMTTGTVIICENIEAMFIPRRTIASRMFTPTKLERANARYTIEAQTRVALVASWFRRSSPNPAPAAPWNRY